MKKTIHLLFALFTIEVNAQTTSPPATPPKADAIIKKIVAIDDATRKATDPPDNLLVSRVGLNKFFARKIGYFLTGNENPSLHRNFLFLNAGDNELIFGHNRYFTRENDRIKSVVTYGLKADLKDGFSELGNQDGLKGNFGLNLKYSYYFNGGIKYDDLSEWQTVSATTTAGGPQKCSMNTKRRLFLSEQMEKLKKESIEHEQTEKNYVNDETKDECDSKTELVKEASDDFYKVLEEKYLKTYYDKEVELLDEWEAKDLVRTGWFSLSGFLPFTPKTYSVTTNLTELPGKKLTYEGNGSLNFYYLIEHKKSGKWLFNAGMTGEWNNSIKNEEMDKYTINQMKAFGNYDSVYINQKDGDIYYGVYQEYISGKFTGQITYFPRAENCKFFSGDWGISAKYEYQFDGLNDKVNLKFGLPFLLKGKDEDSPVNFEVQFKLNDIYRWTSTVKKYSVGISVGLPFSSVLYKA